MASKNFFNETRAGLMPNTDELSYEPTTDVVCDFMVAEINAVLGRVAKNNGRSIDIHKDDINLITIEAGSSFYPFIIGLPSVLIDKKTNKGNEVDPIFENKGENGDNTTILVPEIYRLLRCFTYNKEDNNAFQSTDWRRARGVSRQAAAEIMKFRTPKVYTRDNTKTIFLLLDPLRIFNYMLASSDNNIKEDYKISIDGVKKIKNGKYVYYVSKKNRKNKKNKNDTSIFEAISRNFRGR